MRMSLCQPRIGREIFLLTEKYGEVISKVDPGHFEGDATCIIMIIINDLDVELKIILDNRYPFVPPRDIFVNGNDYRKIINDTNHPLRDIYTEYQYPENSNIASIIFHNNWYTGKQLTDIYDEVLNVIKKKQHVLNIYYCRKLASQWLTHDIPLEHYL
jgi:hypothetical protein